MAQSYLPRLADRVISDLTAKLPALLVVGPRATGKTTTTQRHAASVVRLDNPAQAEAMRADPDTVLSRFPEPILLDEWQAVPAVLGAVKRAVDTDFRPGRFILTGSVRADLDTDGWPGTGRLVRVEMHSLCVRELLDKTAGARTFVDTVVSDGVEGLRLPAETPDLIGYLELAVRGGFPQAALVDDAESRYRLLDGYIDQLLTRDLQEIGSRRDPERLRTFLESLALNTAGVVTEKTLFETAGINRATALSYESSLRDLYICDALPAWSSNRLKRLTRAPKRYIADSGLAAALLGIDVDGLVRDGDLLGRLVETLVVAQLRTELDLGTRRARLFHLRQEKGLHEVDIIVELPMGRVIGIEVKATSAPRRESAAHLIWLRDELGDKFIGGVVLHTGPHSYPLTDKIVAAPICTLWA